MSPEQALGLAADARSDVWGLGARLYQVLTGRPPVAGGSIASAVGHAATGEVAPVRALEPGVPADSPPSATRRSRPSGSAATRAPSRSRRTSSAGWPAAR